MKILLVGEYSRLHNSLKEGLLVLGHEVTIIGTGDYFKNFPVDIKLHRKYNSGFGKKLKVLLYKLFDIDIASISIRKQFFSNCKKLEGFDIVQLINESPFGATPKVEMEIISFLKKNNKYLFLLSCGTDHLSVKYAFEKKPKYSILNAYFEGRESAKSVAPILKYLKPEFESLHHFVYTKIDGVIASDLDYHLPLIGNPKYLGLIPNPINIEKLHFHPNVIQNKIIIFHGINRGNYYKKGNDYFEKALETIKEKYSEKVEIITVENLPYEEYIEKYNSAHILLDQVFAYDQGYNALEAMAKGKVVFTGAEKEFLEYYNLNEDEVCINALPDIGKLVEKLGWLIENPEKITEIGKNARSFIEREHYYVKIASKYEYLWSETKNQ